MEAPLLERGVWGDPTTGRAHVRSTGPIKIGVGDRGNMHWAMIRELGTVPEKSGSWARGTGIMDKRTGDRELSEPERVMY